MTSAPHYRSNLRDTFFQLFEVLDIGSTTLEKGPFASMDPATARASLEAAEKLAVDELQKSFAESDRVPLTLDKEGTVTIPPGLVASYEAFYDAGANLLALPEAYGGLGAPPSVTWAAFELAVGANPAIAFYVFGTVIARTIDRHGTDAQKKRFIQTIVDRRWGGSMVLTEPDAGSDVGAGRTKARHIEGDLYEIEGTKRFITNGDFHSVENIVHMVLARPEGAGGGTKGLSLFIVPKFWVNEDGSLGERNGAVVAKIEKKMGIKGSATCEMVFGDGKPARGLLLGNVHDGIRQMFHIIEQARKGRRHQEHVDALDGLSQCPRVRERADAGARSPSGHRQDLTAGEDHPPPRRSPHVDEPKGTRRRDARALPLYRVGARPGRAPRRPRREGGR